MRPPVRWTSTAEQVSSPNALKVERSVRSNLPLEASQGEQRDQAELERQVQHRVVGEQPEQGYLRPQHPYQEAVPLLPCLGREAGSLRQPGGQGNRHRGSPARCSGRLRRNLIGTRVASLKAVEPWLPRVRASYMEGMSPSCIIRPATSGCELNRTILPSSTRAK